MFVNTKSAKSAFNIIQLENITIIIVIINNNNNIILNCYKFINRAASMTLRTVLLSLQALMANAEPDDPQDAVVAKQYKEHPEMFAETAAQWTNIYAGGILYLIIYLQNVIVNCFNSFNLFYRHV